MENFVLYNEIGKVGEQTIYKARRKGTVKYLAISCADRNRRPLISNHVRFASLLKHSSVVKFQEWYETSNHLWLVMELCTGGSLEQVIKEDGRLPENLVRNFGLDIVRGLEFIHTRGVIFNDLKPSRFLLDGIGRIRLFDFSLSHLEEESLEEVLIKYSESGELDEDVLNAELQLVTAYTAPEVLKTGEISAASDYWGLGCLLFEMFYGYPPFTGETQEELVEKIIHQEFTIPKLHEGNASNALVKLVSALLVKQPSQRLTTTDLLTHEFWQNHLNDLSLLYSPDTEFWKSDNAACTDDNSELGATSNGNLEDSLEAPAIQAADKNGAALPSQTISNSISNQRFAMAQEALAVRTSLIGASQRQDGFAARTEPVSFTLNTTSPMGISSRKQDYGKSTAEPVEATGEEDALSDTNISDRLEQRRRMTYGEDMPSSTEDGSRTAIDLLRTPRSSLNDADVQFMAKLASPETWATLAMIYPWGDDSPHLPQDIETMLAMWVRLDDSVLKDHPVKETVTPAPRRRRPANRIVSGVSAVTTWKPKQLIDYYRWSRSTPPARVEGLSSSPLSTEKLLNLSLESLDMYLIEVLRLFRLQHDQFEPVAASQPRTVVSKPTTSRPPMKAASFSLVDYLIWLFSTITTQPIRIAIVSGAQSVSRLAILVDLFVESGRQLRAATQLDHRLGLCRLCCLAAHRIASCLTSQQQNASPPTTPSGGACRGTQPQQSWWWHAVCLSLPSCLATLIDILREPTSSRTSHRLCQLSLLAVGEVLLCAACVLQAIFRLASLQPATIAGGGQGNVAASAPLQLDISASQWQVLVHCLLRYLSPPSSTSLGGSERASAAGDRQPSRTPAASGRVAGSDGVVTEAHVRLAAARTIDAFVIAILANDLHDPSAVCPSENCNLVAGTSLSTATQAVGAVTNLDVVIRLWTELIGYSDGLSTLSSLTARPGQTGNQLRQDLALTCASAIAGIVRINPALFTSSLIGRVSLGQFVRLLEPPSNNLTTLATRLMSAAASGLLLPLYSLFSDKTKQQQQQSLGLTRQQNKRTGGTGTPAACRRILSDKHFVIAVFRYLECPHTMLRCKAYLLSAAIITTSPQDTFPLAFDARLPLCLERDLRATEQIKCSQTQSTNVVAADACPAEDSSPSAGNSDTKRLVYLAATTQYFVDVLVTSIVPLICNRVSSALGCSLPSGPRKSHNVPHALPLESACPGPGHRSSNSSDVNTVMARAWLPAYQCISNLIVSCPMIRARVLTASTQPDRQSQATAGSVDEAKTEERSSGQRQQIPEFSLLVFLGQLLNFWASTDPISSAATVASVHQPGSVENQLLFTSLVIIEEFSQQAELVEICRRDFICLVLPGLARLAVGSGARPETRTICAKIINNIAEQLRCERSSGSLSSLYYPELQHYLPRQRQGTTSRGRPLSADADVLMMESTATAAAASDYENAGWSALAKTQSLSDIPSIRNVDRTQQCRSLYLPQAGTAASGGSQRSVGGRSRQTSVSGGSSSQNNLAAAFHPPSTDAIAQLFEVVNQLMIPYADTLIACPEAPSAQTAFIRLLHVLLTTIPSQEPPPPPSTTSATRNFASEAAATDAGVDHSTAARTLVAGISSHGLDISLVRLLASQLLASGGAEDANQHYCTPSEPLHVTSTLCLAIFRLVPQLLRWPQESRPSRMIIDLRLLELVTIAVLQLGDCFEAASRQAWRPDMASDSPLELKIDGNKVTRVPKSAGQKSSQQTTATLQTGRPGQRKMPVTSRRPGFQVNGTGTAARSSIPSMCTPLVAALEAMNALLNHVAHVVRIALTARSANYPENETVALAAEEILAASRPPLGLAGLLVRLIPTWEPGSERGTDHQLGELAIRGLTSFASLYGGEYSRTALTRPASSCLSMALLYLSLEDEKVARAKASTTVTGINRQKPPRQPKPSDEFLVKRSRTVYRRRLRLLLRIIRRLISSDPVCRGYLLQEASMKKEKANLYTTLEVLSVKAERTADATTLKLLREIIGIVAPSTKFMRSNRTVNSKKCSKERAAPVVQAQAIGTAI